MLLLLHGLGFMPAAEHHLQTRQKDYLSADALPYRLKKRRKKTFRRQEIVTHLPVGPSLQSVWEKGA